MFAYAYIMIYDEFDTSFRVNICEVSSIHFLTVSLLIAADRSKKTKLRSTLSKSNQETLNDDRRGEKKLAAMLASKELKKWHLSINNLCQPNTEV